MVRLLTTLHLDVKLLGVFYQKVSMLDFLREHAEIELIVRDDNKKAECIFFLNRLLKNKLPKAGQLLTIGKSLTKVHDMQGHYSKFLSDLRSGDYYEPSRGFLKALIALLEGRGGPKNIRLIETENPIEIDNDYVRDYVQIHKGCAYFCITPGGTMSVSLSDLQTMSMMDLVKGYRPKESSIKKEAAAMDELRKHLGLRKMEIELQCMKTNVDPNLSDGGGILKAEIDGTEKVICTAAKYDALCEIYGKENVFSIDMSRYLVPHLDLGITFFPNNVICYTPEFFKAFEEEFKKMQSFFGIGDEDMHLFDEKSQLTKYANGIPFKEGKKIKYLCNTMAEVDVEYLHSKGIEPIFPDKPFLWPKLSVGNIHCAFVEL